jgi:hypothetical protein
MFLPPIELKKVNFASNASRNATKFLNIFSLQTKVKHLSLKKK